MSAIHNSQSMIIEQSSTIAIHIFLTWHQNRVLNNRQRITFVEKSMSEVDGSCDILIQEKRFFSPLISNTLNMMCNEWRYVNSLLFKLCEFGSHFDGACVSGNRDVQVVSRKGIRHIKDNPLVYSQRSFPEYFLRVAEWHWRLCSTISANKYQPQNNQSSYHNRYIITKILINSNK